MNIWQAHDFLFALLWGLLAAGLFASVNWIAKQLDADKALPGKERKFWKVMIFVFRLLGCVTVAAGIGTLALPLLDALLTALLGTASNLFDKYGGFAILIGVGVLWWKNKHSGQEATPAAVTDVDIELARQKALDMQGYALGLMLRVLIAISSFTPVLRPRHTHDIEIRSTDGASFYMKDDIVIYQAEAEVEGDITPEVEDTIQREAQRYAQKYITDYPMLVSSEAGGRAPVEVLGVKNCGSRVLIDFVFTSAKSIGMIDDRRRARVERQMKQERPAPYTDPDYGE